MNSTVTTETMHLNHPELFQSRQQGETSPAIPWLNKIQKEAWDRYQATPMPVRTDEKWRFANLSPLESLDQFVPTPFAAPDAENTVDQSHRFEKVSGRLVFVDDNIAAPRWIDPEVEKKGVVFTTLLDAWIRFPEKVREVFLQQSPELGSEKFEALHIALLRNGTFLHVPDNVEIEEPFVVYNWTRMDGGAIFPHTLFVTGKHAKANLIEFQEAASPETRHFVVANSHLYADDGSKPSHTILQNWNRNTLSFQLNTSNAQAHTQTSSAVVNIGSSMARQEIHGKIFGRGANVELYSLNVPTGEQVYDQRTLQSHVAGNSRSDLLFKNALLDKSRAIFSGLIIVEEDAQQTDAYQTNNNLMLSKDAEANSLPGLEIKANDVKCSHGATTGRIDDSELFYFLARGIPRTKAQELMVFGYFEEIIEKLKEPQLAGYIRDRVQRKLTD